MSGRPAMTCRELIEFLDRYVDGDLLPAHRHEFERHLAACAACREYLAGYRQAIRLGRAALRPHPDPVAQGVPPDLVEAVLAARRAGGAGTAAPG